MGDTGTMKNRLVIAFAFFVVTVSLIGFGTGGVLLSREIERQSAKLDARISDVSNKLDARVYDFGKQLEARDAETKRTLKVLTEHVAALNALLRVPTLDNLTLTSAAGLTVKTKDYKLAPDTDVLTVTTLRGIDHRKAWAPSGPTDLMFPWPKVYVEVYKQEFSPWTLAQNLVGIAEITRRGSSPAGIGSVVDYLLQQIDKYTDEKDGARYVRFDFDHDILYRAIPSGWHSAFANASVAFGLMEMYRATGNAEYLDIARPYVDALLKPSEIVLVDEGGYLWLEECPPVNDEQFHIINGHIFALFALHHWWQMTGDARAAPVVKAAITTVHRYLPEYRKPGKVSAYALINDYPDYGPQRIVNFIGVLHKLTGEPFFARFIDVLRTDMAVR